MASLDIHGNQHIAENFEKNKPIKKFEFHPSILRIKNRIAKNIFQNLFCFHEITKAEALKEINSVNNKKLLLSIQ